MVNKAKKQGTTYETNIVNRLNKNKSFKSQRFAEGGSNDLGDIQLLEGDEEYFIEAKSRQNLIAFNGNEESFFTRVNISSATSDIISPSTTSEAAESCPI